MILITICIKYLDENNNILVQDTAYLTTGCVRGGGGGVSDTGGTSPPDLTSRTSDDHNDDNLHKNLDENNNILVCDSADLTIGCVQNLRTEPT